MPMPSANPTARPRPRRRWVVLAVGTLAQGSFATVFFGIPLLAPVLTDRYGLTLRQTGLMLACVDLGATATLFGWGLLADRIGERVVIVVGLGVASLCVLSAARAGSFGVLCVSLAGAGAFGSAVYTSTGRAVVAAFEPDERGLALAIRHTSNPVAGALAALVLPALASTRGATFALTVLACVVAMAALVATAVLRRAPVAAKVVVSRERHPSRDRRVWTLSAGSGLLLLAQGSVLAFFVVFLHEAHGVDPRRAGILLAVVQLSGAVLRLVAGRWSDKTGSRIAPLILLAGCLTGALLATGATADTSLTLVLVPLAVAGALALSWNALSYTAAAELGGVHAGAALGIQQTALSLGAVSAPIMFALAVDSAGWSVAYLFAAGSAGAGALVLRRLHQP